MKYVTHMLGLLLAFSSLSHSESNNGVVLEITEEVLENAKKRPSLGINYAGDGKYSVEGVFFSEDQLVSLLKTVYKLAPTTAIFLIQTGSFYDYKEWQRFDKIVTQLGFSHFLADIDWSTQGSVQARTENKAGLDNPISAPDIRKHF